MLGYKWKSTCHGLKQAKTRDEQHVECVVVKHSTVKQYSTRASGVGKGYSHGCCCLRHSASGLVATAEDHPWEYPLPTPLALYCLNAASPMFEMSNVLPQHNLHFARPGFSSVLTHDMYFSICSQAWLNLDFPGIIPSASLSYCCYGHRIFQLV